MDDDEGISVESKMQLLFTSIKTIPLIMLVQLKLTVADADLGQPLNSLTVTELSGCPRSASATVNFNCTSIISGMVFIDVNNNCIFDSTDIPSSSSIVSAYNNGIYY